VNDVPGVGPALSASLTDDEPRSASGVEGLDGAREEETAASGLARGTVNDPAAIPRHILGTATHRVLELGAARTPARVREILVDETDGALSPAGLQAASRLVLEWVGRFERSPLGRRTSEAEARDPRHVMREEPFLVQIPLGGGEEPVLLRGTADLVLRESSPGGGGAGVLVDYKTNELTPLEVPAKARSYALQLQLYALAVSAYLGEPIREAWLSFLAADQSVSVDVSADALERARERLANFVAARRRGEFPPNPGSLCRTCAFRSVCPGAPSGMGPAPTPAPANLEVLIGK
jgi:CRISPR/Cas system-associated exonuclease Cas4 (RecB family)